MGNNLTIQNQYCVIPTERSDEGSLTSVREHRLRQIPQTHPFDTKKGRIAGIAHFAP